MKWISVKDKLPEPYIWVLVVTASDAMVIARLEGKHFIDCELWQTVNDITTHWMPLPEPPQDKNEPEFDEYEIYYFNELIAEVKDYRKGFDSIIYGLSTDTQVVKK